MRRTLVTLLVLGSLAAVPSAAGAATFGADLSLPVGGTATCSSAFGTLSCLAYGVTPSSYAPTSGVVNTVRVKTGDFPQGQMQIVVLRSYYQNNLADPGHPNFTCCFLQEYGPTFTPARNAVTPVPVTLGMVEDNTPAANDGNTVAKGDFLALSVLSGSVPIPLSTANASGYTAFYAPAPQGQYPAGVTGGRGAFPGPTVMLNADIDPLSSGGGGGGNTGGGGGNAGGGGGNATPPPAQPAPVTPPPPTALLAINGAGGQLAGNTATLPLVCQLTTACNGVLQLTDKAPAAAASAAAKKRKPKKPTVYGSSTFSIPAGQTVGVSVKLGRKAKKLVRKNKQLTAVATATVGGQVTSTKVTFKAAKRK